jgi:hypothetical protein
MYQKPCTCDFYLVGTAVIDKYSADFLAPVQKRGQKRTGDNPLGKDGATNLLNWVDDAHVQELKTANRLALAKTAAKIVLGSGIGGIGYELLK